MESIRTFIAFDTPEEIRGEILKLQDRLRSSDADVRWESSGKFHVTIKFLGDVRDSHMAGVLSRIAGAVKGRPPFAVTYQRLGAFPDRKRPRVIWLGCENTDGTLLAMKEALDRELQPLGFEIEERRFHPHVTLGRVKSPRRLNNLTPMLESLTFEPRNGTVDTVSVMRSVLNPQGAQYSILQSLHL